MKKLSQVSFAAHARIKDVLGRELINSDNVAIIELIKNARDAGSKSVDITFSNAEDCENPFAQIIIQDTGSGMSLNDIKYKWLNIAYSDKKHGTDAQGMPYAGNKGIGRFSCDRLGKQLELYTRAANEPIIRIPIDWTKFEVDERNKRVSDILLTTYSVTDQQLKQQTHLDELTHGTILIVKSLRNSWDVTKLTSLKKELERFALDRDRRFKVRLHALDFADEKGLNGLIENKVFDKLDFRTTSIHSNIDESGKEIQITLKHDAREIFTLVEKNSFPLLRNIKVVLYFLNQPAKAFFKRETKYAVKDFGSVFLFLNGFRITPYGEPTNDWLQIDSRKAQGYARTIGTRDLVGFVEITDSKNQFRVTSSREGLVQNEAFDQLVSDKLRPTSKAGSAKLHGYLQNLIRKLERFVVDGLDWDRVIWEIGDRGNNWELNKPSFYDRDKGILESLGSVIHLNSIRENITHVTYNNEYLSQLAAKENSAYDTLLKDLEIRFKGLPISQLKPADKRDINRFISRQAKILEAKEDTNIRLQEIVAKVKKSAEQLTSENLFLRAQAIQDPKVIEDLHHQVIIYADTIATAIDNIRIDINDGINEKTFKKFLDRIQVQNEKILTISRHATNANYKISSALVKADLFTFIKKYLLTLIDLRIFAKIEIVDEIDISLELTRKFRPLEMTIAIDNVIVNARKAGASRIKFTAQEKDKTFLIKIVNNGEGLSKDITDKASVFLKGVTTSDGSGLGLYHLARIVEKELKGSVSLLNTSSGNFTIGIELR